MEAVEWAKPAIIRAFTSGQRVLSFDPEGGPEDVAVAEHETAVVAAQDHEIE